MSSSPACTFIVKQQKSIKNQINYSYWHSNVCMLQEKKMHSCEMKSTTNKQTDKPTEHTFLGESLATPI